MNHEEKIALAERLDLAQKELKLGRRQKAVTLLREIVEYKREIWDEKDILEEAGCLHEKIMKQQANRTFRRTVLYLFFATAIVIIILSGCKVWSTFIEAHIIVDEICFKLSDDWEILPIEAREIGLTLPADLALEVLQVEKEIVKSSKPSWELTDYQGEMNIIRNYEYLQTVIQSNYLKVSSFSIDSGAVVRIVYNESLGNQLLMSVTKGNVELIIETADTVLISCINCSTDAADVYPFTESQKFRIQLLFGELSVENKDKLFELAIEFPLNRTASDQVLARVIPVDSVGFTKMIGDFEESVVIENGSVYFPELKNQELTIKNGDFFVLQDLREFFIRSILANKNLEIRIEGRTGLLKTGTSSQIYSRMPSLLEWIYNNQFLALIIGTLLPLFTFIMAGLNRLNVIEKN